MSSAPRRPGSASKPAAAWRAQTAQRSGLTAESQSFPAKLVLVKGGRRNAGAFVVQCIAVGTTTVTVVQGMDLRPTKGRLGTYADAAHTAIMRAAK